MTLDRRAVHAQLNRPGRSDLEQMTTQSTRRLQRLGGTNPGRGANPFRGHDRDRDLLDIRSDRVPAMPFTTTIRSASAPGSQHSTEFCCDPADPPQPNVS